MPRVRRLGSSLDPAVHSFGDRTCKGSIMLRDMTQPREHHPAAASFRQLIAQVRSGDEDAAARLWETYEPVIRREIRLRLTDRRLRRTLDSGDVCQSVFANFFARTALGEFELQEPAQLLRLLATMAANRVTDWARFRNAERRDQRRETRLDDAIDAGLEPPVEQSSPSQRLALREVLENFRSRLSGDELQIADMRSQGDSWETIAAQMNATPESLRKRLSRALTRAADELGLEQ